MCDQYQTSKCDGISHFAPAYSLCFVDIFSLQRQGSEGAKIVFSETDIALLLTVTAAIFTLKV